VHVELHHVRRAPKLRALLDGKIDAALVHTAPRTPCLAFTEVSSEPWRAVAFSEHPLAPVARRSRCGRSPATRRCSWPAREPTACASVSKRCAAAPASSRCSVARSPTSTTRRGDRALAWTLLLAPNVPEVGRLGVVDLALTDDLPPTRLWLAHRTNPAPATRAFVALARRLHRTGTLHTPSARSV